MTQATINFSPRFNGSDYSPTEDRVRLTNQYKIIFDLMKDGEYRTLSEIKSITGFGEASISAQMRNMRKIPNGGHTVNKKVVGDRSNGLFAYSLVVKE